MGPSWNSTQVEDMFVAAGATVRRVDRLRLDVDGRRWWEVRSPDTTRAAVATCRDKTATASTLTAADVATPPQVVCDLLAVDTAAASLGWPVCVKPVEGSQGRAVTPEIANRRLLRWAAERASRKGRLPVVVERSVDGDHWRVLVVGQAVSASECREWRPVGDGRAPIDRLIERENRRRVKAYDRPFKIKLDSALVRTLADQGVQPTSILGVGEEVRISTSRNVHQGAQPVERFDDVPVRVVATAEAAVAAIDGLAHAAVDLIDDGETCWVVDVNSNPGLACHLHPYGGRSRAGQVRAALVAAHR